MAKIGDIVRKKQLPKTSFLARMYSKVVYIKEVTEKGLKNPYFIGLPRGCCGNDRPD
jgi:hypothetical protein